MGKIWQAFKIRSFCESKGIDFRTAIAYVLIHNATEGGKKNVDVFDSTPRETIDSKLRMFNHVKSDGSIGQHVDVFRKLILDPQYRTQMYEGYLSQVKPRIDRYGFKDMLLD